MDTEESELIKHREIGFVELHPDPNQARTAAELLLELDGILHVEDKSPLLLNLSYDLSQISLEAIEGALTEVGLHLDNKLFYRLKRALYYYTEEIERTNMGCPRGSTNCTKKVFARRYQQLEHGCRDNRPDHWRKYL